MGLAAPNRQPQTRGGTTNRAAGSAIDSPTQRASPLPHKQNHGAPLP